MSARKLKAAEIKLHLFSLNLVKQLIMYRGVALDQGFQRRGPPYVVRGFDEILSILVYYVVLRGK